MALGGGTWQTQNKVLPGYYVNFSSVPRASAALSDRGFAAAPFELNWGPEGEVFAVTSGEFQKNSKTIFGYAYDHPKMLPCGRFSPTPPPSTATAWAPGPSRPPTPWPRLSMAA